MNRKTLIVFCMFFLSVNFAFSRDNPSSSLNAIMVKNAPVVDGVVDDIWANAPALTVPLGETFDIHDPTSISDCVGCHKYDSNVTVTLKSVYTSDRLYILATWPDPTASFTRGGAWSFANGTWEKPNSDQSEDRMSFLWPIGAITGNPFNTGGCMAKCHSYNPTDTDPHQSTHGIVDDAWLESGRADMWHSKAGRGTGYLSTSGTNLTIDAATHEVTGGTFSMLGFADDKYVDVWQPDSINGEDGGRYGDAGSSAYSHNRIGDKSRPKYMEKSPVDFSDAMILTQEEIDAGEVVGDGTAGVSDTDAATYWPVYASLDAIVPERILRTPVGSRADLAFGSVWTNGTWSAEFGRDLNTGTDDDVQFDVQNVYPFGIAEFDNVRHGYQHRTSKMYTLNFIPAQPAEGELFVKKVMNAPVVDGVVDDIWANAPALTVPLGETFDIHDPTSISDCVGCHKYDSNVTVTLKSVYTSDRLYILATWPDPTASFTRGGAWSFANGTWEKPNSDQSEDRMSFLWPIGAITGNPFNTGGCMAKCHSYNPTDTDPHQSTHGIVDDAWLESGRADMWHSKAGRGTGYLSTSGTNLTIDAATHEVTGGTFSMLGFADDKYVDVWQPDSINGEDGGRYGDAGSSAYSHNRIGDKSRPKYMEKSPVDFSDAMILTQEEIDAGEVVGDGTAGVSDTDAATYWPVYASLDAIVPERILRTPVGSRADLAFGSVWTNGTWSAEFGRDLNTGTDDDVQFDVQNVYPFGIAEFDNVRHGYQHRTSKMYTMRFDLSVSVADQTDDIPQSFSLIQNYPNPFNPGTNIEFHLAKATTVTLTIYNLLGQKVQTVLLDKRMNAGVYRIPVSMVDASSGVYIYRIETPEFKQTKKMTYLR